MNSSDPSHDPLRTADGGKVRSPDDVLPPVQAPSASFLLQLFFIPLIIVMIIVAVWGMFSWLVQLGSDPRDLIADIQKLNDASWQKAYLLADFLRNPEYDDLKTDKAVASDLAEVLDKEIESASMNKNRVLLRTYLCSVLGEFRVIDVLPVLVKAARTEREPTEVNVRCAAARALAVLADQLGKDTLRSREDVMNVLLDMSRESAQSPEDGPLRSELRSSAAYALGVIGGDEALDRLERMLSDAHANTRYNAATGLARYGDARAVPVLVEMLDPENEDALRTTDKENRIQKQMEVISAGIAASARMTEAPKDKDLDPLKQALQQLADSQMPAKIRLQAKEAVLALEQSE
jgi:HEAT repeat protein